MRGLHLVEPEVRGCRFIAAEHQHFVHGPFMDVWENHQAFEREIAGQRT
jgi:hypothetical protein